jgi:hypothetical protein
MESRYRALSSLMEERWRRQWAAAEARSYGWGGVRAVVSRVTRWSPDTITKGLVELQEREANPAPPLPAPLRKPGAGRKRVTAADPSLLSALEKLADPATRGDPGSALRRTCKSTAQLSVGIGHDTAHFAVEAIARWWQKLGFQALPPRPRAARHRRWRLWKAAPQSRADRLGLPIAVCHFPPGTSQWNKIEHRLFSHLTRNWRGRPLISHGVIVNLIAGPSAAKGLKVRAELDAGTYPTGIKVTDQELASVNLQPADFHGEWNYRVLPTLRVE